MTYQPNVPQAADRISVSQGDLLTNYQQLNLVYGDPNPAANPNSDHYAFDDATANARKHRRVTLPNNSTTPPTPAAANGAMYASTNASNQTWPYWRRDTLATDHPLLPTRLFGEFTTNPVVLRPFGFGISNVVFVAMGRYRVDFSVAFPDTNYTVLTACEIGVPPQPPLFVLAYGQKNVGSVEIQFWRQDGTGFSTLLPTVSIAVMRNG